MFAQLFVQRTEKAIKASIPDPAYLVKKIPLWKLSVKSWSKGEFTSQTAALTKDMISEYQHVKEKMEHSKEEAYHAFKAGNKDKLKVYTTELIKLEQQCNAFDLLVPLVKKVQKNVKTLAKSKECPEEYVSAVASIVYFASYYGMPSFQRFTAQIGYKYGQKYVDRVQQKHKDVDEEIYAALNYNPPKDEVKDRSKDLSSLSKKRAKNEQKLLKDSNAALVSTITDIPSSIANMAKQRPKKRSKSKKSRKSNKVANKDSDSSESDSGSSDSESGSEEYSEDSEEYSESDEEYSGSSSESESESDSSDSEKKKKKDKKDKKDKKEKKEKKESKKPKKTKPMNESDSENPPEPESKPQPEPQNAGSPAAEAKEEVPQAENPENPENPDKNAEPVKEEAK